jgi:UDP-glucose 4-epimerase
LPKTTASVIEVLDSIKKISGIDFDYQMGERRAGDPPRLVANVTRIDKVLGIRTKFRLDQIVESAWNL